MSDCTISSTGYDSFCTVLKHKIVIARKNHLCSECGKTIIAKSSYNYFAGVFDGDFHVSKTCLDCCSLRDTFFPNGGYTFGYVRDYVAEQIHSLGGEVSSECILSLTDKAKKFVFDKIEAMWKDAISEY